MQPYAVRAVLTFSSDLGAGDRQTLRWAFQYLGNRSVVRRPSLRCRCLTFISSHHKAHTSSRNIVTFNIGYLTITADDMLDFDWLDSIAPETEIGPLRHIALESPLKVVLDSRDSEAIVLR